MVGCSSWKSDTTARGWSALFQSSVSCGWKRAAGTTVFSRLRGRRFWLRVRRRVLVEPSEEALYFRSRQCAHLSALQARRQRDDAEAHAHEAAHGNAQRLEQAPHDAVAA